MTIKAAYDSAEGNIKEDYMEFFSAFPLRQYKFPEAVFFFNVQNGESSCCCRLGHNQSWYRNRDQSVNDLYTTNKELEGW